LAIPAPFLIFGVPNADAEAVKIVLVAAVAALGIGWFNWHHAKVQEEQTMLGLIASSLAGRTVHVHCQSALGAAVDVSGEEGSVWFDASGRPADHTDLAHDACVALSRFHDDVRSPAFDCVLQNLPCPQSIFDDVQAAHTLAHESAHLAGQQSEAGAECQALHTTAYVAQRLGADGAHAYATSLYAYRHIYPRLPELYQEAGCSP
jgi:hypothetical protein